jgi:hypothetical protein
MELAHDVGSKIGSMTGKLRERRIESRLEDLDRENVRLRTEIDTLRSDLDREWQERKELLEPLRDRKRSKLVVKPRRRSGFMRLATVGLAAYVLGTRAGHERWEQIRGAFGRAKDKVGSLARGDTARSDSDLGSMTSMGASAPTGSAETRDEFTDSMTPGARSGR